MSGRFIDYRSCFRYPLSRNPPFTSFAYSTNILTTSTQLAYLVGLPPNEVPAVEIARGDLVEITPASYGVISRAWHFWSGEGRGDAYGENLYENFAEATSGKGSVLPDSGVNFAADALNMEKEAEEEEGREKEERGEKVMEAAKAVGKIAEQAAANTAAGAGVANSGGSGSGDGAGAGAGGVGQGARGPGKALRRWGSERGKGRGLPGLSELNEADEGEENKDKDDGGVVSEGEGEGRESGKTRSRASELDVV